jgi:glycosyltransferase involved in cell wall biosynthesis
VEWRAYEGLPVVEIVNNWECASFRETYRPALITERLIHVLHAVQPDVVHIHNLMNLSFDLPALARARQIPSVATLHDYTLVCPSGGQRIHRQEAHVCRVIDAERCVRCFRASPFHAQLSFARIGRARWLMPRLTGVAARLIQRRPALRRRLAPLASRLPAIGMSRDDIDERLAAARRVFENIDLAVAPSASLATEFERLGFDRSKVQVSDYGVRPLGPPQKRRLRHAGDPLRIGYIGTLVWHKGVHVLVEAVRALPPSAYEVKIFGDPGVFPEYTASVRSGAEGLPVRFMAAFERGRASEVYAGIDVLVVPSLWLENSPLVIHEAFMAGVPVVAASIGGIPDLVVHERNGLLYDPRSPAQLTEALQSLIDSPSRLRELAEKPPSVKSIMQDAHEWEAIYSEVATRRAAGRPT